MHKTKLINYLKTFSKSELTQFGKFLQSPYFNNSKQLIQLFQILKRHHPKFESKVLDNKIVFRKIFPNQKNNDKRLGNLLSDMNKLIEKFWIVQQIEEEPQLLKKQTVKIFHKRKMGVYFKREVSKLLEELEEFKPKSLQDFQTILEFHHLNYFHTATDKAKKNHESIKELNDYTNYFFAYAKLLYGSELLSKNNIFRKVDMPLFMEEVKNILIPKLSIENLNILLLKKIANLIIAPLSKDILEDTYLFFKENFAVFSTELKHIGFFQLLNYISRQQINGTSIFRQRIAELYWFGYHQNLIVIDGKMSMLTYLNFINVTTPFSQKSDLLQFMKQAPKLLKENYKTFAIDFGKATFYFLTKDFETANKILYQISEIPPLIRLSYRTVELRISLELSILDKNHFSVFFNQSHNFGQFIKREQIQNPNRHESFQNFFKFILRLGKSLKEKELTDSVKISLIKDIETTEKVYLKFWLLEKIGEL